MTNEVLRKWVAAIVVVMWTISGAAALITNNVLVLGAVTPVMMFVMGFLFGFGRPNMEGKE